MKILVLVLTVLLGLNCFAIDWVEIISPLGKVAYLDKDSIYSTDKYYFYNIKYKPTGENTETVQTIQSSKFHPFAARINVYSLEDYLKLNGDYKNIDKNKATKLEIVSYNSLVATCFRVVYEIMAADALKIKI